MTFPLFGALEFNAPAFGERYIYYKNPLRTREVKESFLEMSHASSLTNHVSE
jgi:hypothetical protein